MFLVSRRILETFQSNTSNSKLHTLVYKAQDNSYQQGLMRYSWCWWWMGASTYEMWVHGLWTLFYHQAKANPFKNMPYWRDISQACGRSNARPWRYRLWTRQTTAYYLQVPSQTQSVELLELTHRLEVHCPTLHPRTGGPVHPLSGTWAEIRMATHLAFSPSEWGN